MNIHQLIEVAVKAPSSHNSQPWVFELEGEGVLLFADRTWSLPVNDPQDRELTISCGAALLNLRIAAAAAGLGAEVSLLPERNDQDLLARIQLGAGRAATHEDRVLAEAIGARYTHRQRFQDREVPPALVARMREAAEGDGARLLGGGRRRVDSPLMRLAAGGNAPREVMIATMGSENPPQIPKRR